MEDPTSLFDDLLDKAENYGKTSLELYKLKTVDKMSAAAAAVISRSVIMLVWSQFFVVINFGIALWLGDLMGKSFHGFFAVAGFYAVVGTILYVFRRSWIETPLGNAIIANFLQPDNPQNGTH